MVGCPEFDNEIKVALGIWKTIRAAFGTHQAPDAQRLNAGNEEKLSESIKALSVGDRGWITLSEARALFSPMDDEYAFGEMDEMGRTNIAVFAAEREHRSVSEFMPAEGRVYFTRKAT